MRVCDGCGAPADETHIRQRIERLELSTRYRPIHVQVLLLDDSPPVRADDYFYAPHPDGSGRSPASSEEFRETLLAAGIEREAGMNEAAALAELQHRGFYLAYALECPVAAPGDLIERVRAALPTVVKRIEFSYRPKQVVLIGAEVKRMLAAFQKTTFADRLVAPDGPGEKTAGHRSTGAQIAAAVARFV